MIQSSDLCELMNKNFYTFDVSLSRKICKRENMLLLLGIQIIFS